MLEDFEVFRATGMEAAASITKNGTTFNKVSFEKIGKANYVTLFINREKKQFAIRPCGQSDANAMQFGATIKEKSPSIRWNNKEFLRLISEIMDWDLEHCKGFKVPGEYFKNEKVLLFDLSKATKIV